MFIAIIVNASLFGINEHKSKSSTTEPVVELYEESVYVTPDSAAEDSAEEYSQNASSDSESFSGEYLKDVSDAAAGKRPIDPYKVYTVRAMLPVGELLVLSTASGCALLDDPTNVESAKNEALEFQFKIADLEDCARLSDSLMNGLKEQIALEWNKIGKTPMGQDVKSSTILSEINVRSNGRNNAAFPDEIFAESDSTMELASQFLATNLRVNIIPTTADGVFVFHFFLSDEATESDSINNEELRAFNDALLAINKKIQEASPEELEQMKEEYKNKLLQATNELKAEISSGTSLLESLSNDNVANVECTDLDLDKCEEVEKCKVVTFNGNKTCMVSPKTIFWLMETGCGLQSKPGLLSIARDLLKKEMIKESEYQNLRQSFNLAHICDAIVHRYMSADIDEIRHHERKRAFEF
ncbi:hypothetical protein BdWA1_000661 [Babesia duncani]|uniref:Uncharacterized protein n=1 Tax=Babesia duncani TaxID=323732 RepID=A0AAD9PMR0_9APIC|nr:hypothetical protein BdWA1_000661 [Babesia duncani]